MSKFTPNCLMTINYRLSDISIHIQEQIKNQHEQIIQIQQSREKTTELLQKQLEKLNQTIIRLSNHHPTPKFDQFEFMKNQQYKYELKMDQDLELPCYRNRIFSIKLRLVNREKTILNNNSILVELQLWTYDKIPKKLSHNNKNQSIYKGCQQTTIRKGRGCLNRIQIKEVSSHFPKGMFMLVVMPIDDGAVIGDENKNLIKKEWIKPLIISDVPIKAKKFSDRHNPYYARSDNTVNINDYS